MKFFKPTQLVSSVILVILFGGYGSAKSVLDRFITIDTLAYALKYPPETEIR